MATRKPYSRHALLTSLSKLTSLAQKGAVKVGIRAEHPSRIWERRAPLTPDAVYELTRSGQTSVDVVSCTKRIFKDEEYRKAGARIVSKLDFYEPNSHRLVLGIKEPPLDEVINGDGQTSTTHMMFSHTVKGQEYNMPLLSKFVDPRRMPNFSKPRLVDYELLVDSQTGKRTVGFGWYAGVAGVLEGLSSLGHYYLDRGIATPFLYTPRPHSRPSLGELKAALMKIGTLIQEDGLPTQIGPCIIGVTGSGQVSQGALSMLSGLPIERISVKAAQQMLNSNSTDLQQTSRTIYLVHVKPEDYIVQVGSNIASGPSYDRSLYYSQPKLFESVFHQEVAPYLTLLINGAGWSPGFPRLMTTEQLTSALTLAAKYPGFRGCNIADISCDVGGGLEFMHKATTISEPFFTLQGLPAALPPVQIMSVDILPATIPLDASLHFSNALMPYVRQHLDWCTGDAAVKNTALEAATVAANGLLSKNHRWLHGVLVEAARKYRSQLYAAAAAAASATTTVAPPEATSSQAAHEAQEVRAPPRKKILMLGSGMVAQPAVDMIARRDDIELIIASNSAPEMRALAEPYENVKWQVLDLGVALGPVQYSDRGEKGGRRHQRELYESLLRTADVVISLLPAPMHPDVAKSCIQFKTHLVTASYISANMAQLHEKAEETDVLLLNEVGLDPGIDHCSALELIDRLRGDGKTITSFISFCGGLPAPEFSHVPLRYKFSWRPQGVLTAALNEAMFLLNGEEKHVPGRYLLANYIPNLPISSEFELEGLPNRDSLSYVAKYDLPKEDLRTFVRGTIRYPGFSRLMGAFAKLGLLDNTTPLKLTSWQSLVSKTTEMNPDFNGNITSILDNDEIELVQEPLQYLGLIKPAFESERSGMPPLLEDAHTPLDLFAYLLAHKLRYQPHEQDMVVLSHQLTTKGAEGDGEELHTSTLISYGTQVADMYFKGERPASAMARTVGYPVAIAALLIVDEAISLRGVQGPLLPEVYEAVLDGLEAVGIRMVEHTQSYKEGRPVERALLRASTARKEELIPVVKLSHLDARETRIEELDR